jgi:hypothetical protein
LAVLHFPGSCEVALALLIVKYAWSRPSKEKHEREAGSLRASNDACDGSELSQASRMLQSFRLRIRAQRCQRKKDHAGAAALYRREMALVDVNRLRSLDDRPMFRGGR